jgi:sortase (surface protein transpeptidase)
VPTAHAQRGGGLLNAVARLLALLGAAMVVVALLSQDPAPPAPDTGVAIAVRNAAPLPTSRPIGITIPAIGVHSTIVRLGVASDRQLQVPSDPATVGWYRGSSAPGSAGAAVIAGHVTWAQEPAVFFKLGALRPGQRVHIQRADGRTAIFAITKLAQYDKGEFPTAKVYRPVDGPELRLITCGGRFDANRDSYTANVVAYATLVKTRATSTSTS